MYFKRYYILNHIKFKRKSIIIEFIKLIIKNLRKAIINIFFNSTSLNFKREIKIIINNIIITIIKERIGLNYYKKLFIIYRDNILNNNIFYNHFYNLLFYNYNNNLLLNIGLLKCHFYTRLFKIQYIIYLIAFIINIILK